jgi:subtilase family serine protease
MSLDGTGQTITIVDAFDDPKLVNSTASNFSTSDLHVFDQKFGLPDPPSFVKVGQTGGAPPTSTDSTGGWESEEALDVEWAHAMAPKANIVLVETNSASDSDLYAGVDYARGRSGVSVVSMSFGRSESSGDPSLNSHFLTPSGHSGVTFVASSGDTGVVEYPATSPNVVAVGGTNLSLDASNNYSSETGARWVDIKNVTYTGGGGISGFESQPAYQKGVVTQSTTKRTNPDVAYVAGTGVAVCDSYNNGAATPWVSLAGTSVGAPQWSALIAMADQGRALAGLPALDGPSQTLPLLYHLPSSAFHDITSGSNVNYTAGAGYDLVTGRGSPIASKVVAGLVQPFIVAGSGSVLYQVDSTGHFWEYNTSGWQDLGGGGNWQDLGGGVTSIAAGAGGVFALYTDGSLLETTGGGLNLILGVGGASSIAAGAGGVFALTSSGQLLETVGNGFSAILNGVTSFELGHADTPWANGVFALTSSGQLLETVGNGFFVLDSGVKSFLVGKGGGLDVLETNGNLWQYSSASSRTQLDSSVQSIWLSNAGFTVNARERSGNVQQFAT